MKPTSMKISVLLLLIGLIIILYILLNSPISGETLTMILMTELAISASLLIIFLLFYLMHTPEYSDFKNNRYTKQEYLLIVLFTIFTCMITVLFDTEVHAVILESFTVAVILAVLIGGPVLGSIAVGTSFIIDIAMVDDLEYIALMTVFSLIVLGIMSVFGKNLNMKKALILAATIIIAKIFYISAALSMSYGPTITDEDLISTMIATTFNITVTLVAFVHFEKSRVIKFEYGQEQKDLGLASKIQYSAIPRDFPTSKTLDCYGMMEPAKDVGGDFYDFFRIGRNLLAFVIADVSDKGLPAALFMMKAKGVIKSIARVEHEPDRLLTLANIELCTDNEAEQFMTAWVGILDTDTGILRYSNAGHTPPYIKRENGSFEKLKIPKGLVLGVNDMIKYRAEEVKLCDGDVLFIYTDGVNEAFNKKNEEYGHERLVNALNANMDKTPKEIVDSVRKDISDFVKDYAMSDDITMFCIKKETSAYRTITVSAEDAHLDEITGLVEDTLVSNGCPLNAAMKMEIVAEEIFVNICTHGYADEEPGDATLLCRFEDDEVKMVFYYKGKKFDPVSREEIIIDPDINNWAIGGFGIHMIKNLVDHANYKYVGGRNVLTVWKKISE